MNAYQQKLKALRTQTSRAALARFDALTEWRDAEEFAAVISPIVSTGQMTAAKVTNAYVTRKARITPIRLTPKQVTGPAARNGVELLDEYQRPFETIWSGLAEGKDLTEAVSLGRLRLEQLTIADVWLASRAAMDVIQQSTDRIRGWVRVADATACDLCTAADGTPTSLAADIAFHVGCGCTADPTSTEPDSAPADPEAITVHDDDEMGPVLYQAGHSFAGA